MANTVQIKRGNNTSVNAHTGPSGELIYNLDTGRLHAQDGSTAGGNPHALISDVDLKANAATQVIAGDGLTGGGTLAASRTLALNSNSIASLAKADTAVQPAIAITAGTGLTGGGTLAASRTVALNSASIASLGKADTALQAPGGSAGQILAKNSATTNDVVWVSSEAATAVSYGPQTLTEAQQVQARQNIQADKSYDSIASVAAATVPAFVNAIRTNGYYAAGDGGAALYKRVTSEPSHAGKVQSADGVWWELAEKEPSILMFGASVSAANNQNAITQAFAYSKTVRIPAGRFVCDGSAFADGDFMWRLRGEGEGITQLVFTENGSGLQFGFTTPVLGAEVTDLTIRSTVQNSGSAIRVNASGVGRPNSIFKRLHISGDNGSGVISGLAWFNRGLDLINLPQPMISECLFQGATGSTILDVSRSEAAVYITATDAAVIPRVDKCHVLNYGSGVKVRSSATPSIEGIYVNNCDFVFVNAGVDIEFTSGAYRPPQVNITNLHTEALYRCLYIKGAAQLEISGCLLYGAPFANTLAEAVYIEGCVQGQVHNNTIDTRTNGPREGIYIHNCDGINVLDNIITASDTHVAFSGSSSNCVENGNSKLGSGPGFVDVSSSASTNKGGRILSRKGYQWSREGVLEQWDNGSAYVDTNGDIAVTFSRPFPNELWGVTVSNTNADAGSEAPVVLNVSTTGFTIRFPGLTAGPRDYTYVARGI